MDKKYVLFAGVNGAGKSTLYNIFIKDFVPNMMRINSDEILRENGGDWRSPQHQAIAMKDTVKRIDSYMKQGISFNQETTLCGRSILNNIEKAKKLGYFIQMYYVGVGSPEVAIERVKTRVKNGGHGVAEEDIRRRYKESLENLRKAIFMCDRISVFDNTQAYERVSIFENGKTVYVDESCIWLKEYVL